MFIRLLKNRYKKVYVDLLIANTSLARSIENYVKKNKNSKLENPTRIYPLPNVFINHRPVSSCVRIHKKKGYIHYDTQIIQKVDVPLFWGSDKKKDKLESYINNLFLELKTTHGDDISIFPTTVADRHTAYRLIGKIKL